MIEQHVMTRYYRVGKNVFPESNAVIFNRVNSKILYQMKARQKWDLSVLNGRGSIKFLISNITNL